MRWPRELHPVAAALLTALLSTFGRRWNVLLDLDRCAVSMRPRRSPGAYVPARRERGAGEVLAMTGQLLKEYGVERAPLLPVRWRRDTQCVVSAVQALDPYLKDGLPFTLRCGYLPQPVVRFTGPRNAAGELHAGYLTSFVNLSCVRPVATVAQHVELLDVWLTVLSGLGMYAGHLEISGSLRVWARADVRGVTLKLQHAGIGVGDVVLLWNEGRPTHLATDVGFGLERLRWSLSRRAWKEVAFGSSAHWSDFALLDAVRTATLLISNGISPGSQGAANLLRQVLRRIPAEVAATGVGRLVRGDHAYWSLTGPQPLPWCHTSQTIEDEVLREAGRSSSLSGSVRTK